MNDALRKRWHSSVLCLAGELRQPSDGEDTESAVSSIATAWLEKVATLYAEPHRAYHNLTHVEEVLAALDLLMGTQPDSDGAVSCDAAVATLAAFFHDVVYNPQSATNEADSQEMFVDFAGELFDALGVTSETAFNDDTGQVSILFQMASQVEQCIIATATHIASANEARQSDNTIVATFLDADMSILGKAKERYDAYAASIRKEYEFVERSEYCNKRAEILESFLPADAQSGATSPSATDKTLHLSIYATEMGRELWEEQARQNLRREIGMLRRGVIPPEKESS
ncbi:hypothetical protein ACHAXT_000809 [Thalassiosira profunda]